MKIGSLFSGIGGFDLAARWIGWKTKWYSEIDPYAIRVMERHFPEAYNVGDVTEFLAAAGDARQGFHSHKECERTSGIRKANDAESCCAIDILCGGFPCQPVSCAGKRLAQDDPRWLWPHFARIIRTLRPRYVVAENVPGLLGRGATDVLRDFAAIGYDVEWETVPASAVGAPHKRDRVWFIAYPNICDSAGARRSKGRPQAGGALWDKARRAESKRRGGCDGVEVAIAGPTSISDTATQRDKPRILGTDGTVREGTRNHARDVVGRDDVADTVRERQKHTSEGEPWHERLARWNAPASGGWWDVEPPMGRVAHGVPARVDRLRCLGNSIVPQIAYWIFQQIEARENAQRP